MATECASKQLNGFTLNVHLPQFSFNADLIQVSCKGGLNWLESALDLYSCDTKPHTSTHNTVLTIGVLYVAINILKGEENVQCDYHSEKLIIIGLTCLPPESPSSLP